MLKNNFPWNRRNAMLHSINHFVYKKIAYILCASLSVEITNIYSHSFLTKILWN